MPGWAYCSMCVWHPWHASNTLVCTHEHIWNADVKLGRALLCSALTYIRRILASSWGWSPIYPGPGWWRLLKQYRWRIWSHHRHPPLVLIRLLQVLVLQYIQGDCLDFKNPNGKRWIASVPLPKSKRHTKSSPWRTKSFRLPSSAQPQETSRRADPIKA